MKTDKKDIVRGTERMKNWIIWKKAYERLFNAKHNKMNNDRMQTPLQHPFIDLIEILLTVSVSKTEHHLTIKKVNCYILSVSSSFELIYRISLSRFVKIPLGEQIFAFFYTVRYLFLSLWWWYYAKREKVIAKSNFYFVHFLENSHNLIGLHLIQYSTM